MLSEASVCCLQRTLANERSVFCWFFRKANEKTAHSQRCAKRERKKNGEKFSFSTSSTSYWSILSHLKFRKYNLMFLRFSKWFHVEQMKFVAQHFAPFARRQATKMSDRETNSFIKERHRLSRFQAQRIKKRIYIFSSVAFPLCSIEHMISQFRTAFSLFRFYFFNFIGLSLMTFNFESHQTAYESPKLLSLNLLNYDSQITFLSLQIALCVRFIFESRFFLSLFYFTLSHSH